MGGGRDDLDTAGHAHLGARICDREVARPEMQKQRLQTLSIPGQPPRDGYGLGIFNLGGWSRHNGSVPRYEAVAGDLPQKKMTPVILINTDIAHPGGGPNSAHATPINQGITPQDTYN